MKASYTLGMVGAALLAAGVATAKISEVTISPCVTMQVTSKAPLRAISYCVTFE